MDKFLTHHFVHAKMYLEVIIFKSFVYMHNML